MLTTRVSLRDVLNRNFIFSKKLDGPTTKHIVHINHQPSPFLRCISLLNTSKVTFEVLFRSTL